MRFATAGDMIGWKVERSEKNQEVHQCHRSQGWEGQCGSQCRIWSQSSEAMVVMERLVHRAGGGGLTCNRGILKGRMRMDAGFIFHRRLCRTVTVWGGNS